MIRNEDDALKALVNENKNKRVNRILFLKVDK